ncbi:ammonium transporter [Candidatus Magnetomonas plexicatena]|uniref:ammonium transporter n=1 Tax=Candidatus Magnetomonas plexicatena TaxID=2552947 RepID=UPI0010FFFAE7|nr:ammonium transporter [Nitrospirales bacterium LBB_01]
MMRIALTVCFTLIMTATAFAAEGGSQIDKADTAWILVSAAMVLLMTHGLAMFYGGMVRKKNVLGTIMHSFIAIAIVSVQWVVIGYSLAFGPDIKGIIGGLDWAFLRNVGLEPNPDYAGTVPHLAFMIYQAMFAVITPALISGALAERIKFSSFILFTVLWSTVIYAPVAHWVWGKGGWLGSLGVLDFAGGIVVHVTSGLSALAAALYVGKRKGYPHEITPPHNLPLTVIGTGILWFGWFGFNGGSALTSGALSTVAFVTSHIAAVAAVVTWVTIEWLQHGKPTVFGAATASVAGLATITPAAGYVSPMSALIIGILAGSVCYTALNLKPRLGYDDSLDAFGVHGVGGFIGTVCVGIFASLAFNEHGANGLINGNTKQFFIQTAAAAGVGIFSFVVTLILLKVVDIVTNGIRVNHENETEGLDVTQHGESGYYF